MARPGQISGYVKSKFTGHTWPNLARFLATFLASLLARPGQKYDQTWADSWPFLAEVSDTWPDVSKEVKPGQISSYVSSEFFARPGQISGYVKSKFTGQT